MRKGNEPDPDPYVWLMDPDPGGLKHADLDPQLGKNVNKTEGFVISPRQ
jgi:hypothetical protein